MRLQIVRIVIVGILAGGWTAATASAQTAPALKTAKFATGQLGASINSAGLQQSFDFGLSRPVTASSRPWLKDAHVALGGVLAATPAGVRAGSWLEYAPFSFYTVRVGADRGQYFGTFHSLASFKSRLDPFDPDSRTALGHGFSGATKKMYAVQTLQVRVGAIAARATISDEKFTSTAAGPFYYEPTRDTLLDVTGDHVRTIASTVVYQRQLNGGGQVMFGPTHSVMYSNTHSSLNKVQKIGVVAVQQMSGKHFGLVRPNISVQAAYYVDDPNKQNQWGASAAIGFALGRR